MLLKGNGREESPRRRKQGRRDRDDFDNRRGMDRSQSRYLSYRGRDEYDSYNRRDDYRYRNMDRRDDRDDGSGEYYDSRGNGNYYDDSKYQSEKKIIEPEKEFLAPR